MEDAMARNLCSNSAPRSELDHRARDARVRLVRIEQSLAVRAARRGFRLVRLFSWRVNRAPKGGRTQGSLSAPRGGAMPEIDAAWFAACGAFLRSLA
jgi:hypothetical protein